MSRPTKRRRIDGISPLSRPLMQLVGEYLIDAREVLEWLRLHGIELFERDNDIGHPSSSSSSSYWSTVTDRPKHHDWLDWLSRVWAVRCLHQQLGAWLGVDVVKDFCARLFKDGAVMAGSAVIGTLIDCNMNGRQWRLGDVDVFLDASIFYGHDYKPRSGMLPTAYGSGGCMDLLWERCGDNGRARHQNVSIGQYGQLKQQGILATRTYQLDLVNKTSFQVIIVDPLRTNNDDRKRALSVDVIRGHLHQWIDDTFDLAMLGTSFDGQRVRWAGVRAWMTGRATLRTEVLPSGNTITQSTVGDLRTHIRCHKYMERGLQVVNYARPDRLRVPLTVGKPLFRVAMIHRLQDTLHVREIAYDTPNAQIRKLKETMVFARLPDWLQQEPYVTQLTSKHLPPIAYYDEARPSHDLGPSLPLSSAVSGGGWMQFARQPANGEGGI
jgi:hypothetical protein